MRAVIPARVCTDFLSSLLRHLHPWVSETYVVTDNEKSFELVRDIATVVSSPKLEDGYPELFIGEIIESLPADWYLKLDADEWISGETLEKLSCSLLDAQYIYGFPRRWTRFNRGVFEYRNYGRMYSRDDVGKLGHDIAYRYFYNDSVFPDRRLHTVGLQASGKRFLEGWGDIYHLHYVFGNSTGQASRLSQWSLTDFSAFNDVYFGVDAEDAEEWKQVPLHFDIYESGGLKC